MAIKATAILKKETLRDPNTQNTEVHTMLTLLDEHGREYVGSPRRLASFQEVGHACVEMVAESYSYKGRIGQVSKSFGGQETMSFSQKDMPNFIRTLLQPYRRTVLT